MKVLANELGPASIRVNTIHPNSIDTVMVKNTRTFKLFRPDLHDPKAEDSEASFAGLNRWVRRGPSPSTCRTPWRGWRRTSPTTSPVVRSPSRWRLGSVTGARGRE